MKVFQFVESIHATSAIFNLDALFWHVLRPYLCGLGYKRQPSPRFNFIELFYHGQNAVPVDRVKVDSAYLYYIIKCANIPFSLSFPPLFDHNGFCGITFHFFDTNFWASQSVSLKKSCSACHGLPYLSKRDNWPTRS